LKTIQAAKLAMLVFMAMAACSEKSNISGQTPIGIKKRIAPTAAQMAEEAEKAQDEAIQAASESGQSVKRALTGAMALSAEVQGLLIRTETGFAIESGTSKYIVTGKGLAEMVGKNVKAVGTVAEDAGKQQIAVRSVEIIE